ncbi:MAG: GFA family protein [Steroidobacteraceae bacterium]
MSIEGGCLCKSVRYRIEAEPIMMRLCWCRDCQYLSGGNGMANVVFPSAAVTVTGELTDYVKKADSGNILHRRFCSKCGTPVFSQAEVRPHVIIVRAGTLDDPNIIQPSVNIWTDSAPEWACMNSELQQFPKQPPP